MVKLLFFRFGVTNSRLKNKKIHFELLNRWVHFHCHFRVTNVKLINEKISLNMTVLILVNPYKSILLLRFLRTSYKSMSWGCQACSKVIVAWMCSPADGNLWYLCLGTTSLLVPETFKFRNFETWLPATYNNWRLAKY